MSSRGGGRRGRFTRSGPDEPFYQFHVEDPGLYTRPLGGEMALQRATGRMFEYACHEGNYSLPGILAGARRGERDNTPETAAFESARTAATIQRRLVFLKTAASFAVSAR